MQRETRRRSAEIAGRLARVLTSRGGDARRSLAEGGFDHGCLETVPSQAFGANLSLPQNSLIHTAVGTSRSAREVPLDVSLVSAGIRPLALVNGPEEELGGIAAWAESRRLTAWMSAHEYRPISDTGKSGYANLGSGWRLATPGSGASRGLIVGTEPRMVALGWLAYQAGWDEPLGRLLGYPPCCAAAFAASWGAAQRDFGGDPGVMLLAGDRGPFRWEVNIFSRYSGQALINHFPCQFDCAHSLGLARRALQALRLLRPGLVREMAGRMRSIVVHVNGAGIFLVKPAADPPTGPGGSIACRRLIAGPPGQVATLIEEENTMRNISESEIAIGDQQFQGSITPFTAGCSGQDGGEIS